MTTDLLQSSLSPTQERGESPLSGGIIHETITNADGDQFRMEIKYYVVGQLATIEKCEVSGEHGIPNNIFLEIVEELIEKAEGYVLNFQ